MKTRLLVIEQWHVQGLGAAVRILMKLKRGTEQRQARIMRSFIFTFSFPFLFFLFFILKFHFKILFVAWGKEKERERVLRVGIRWSTNNMVQTKCTCLAHGLRGSTDYPWKNPCSVFFRFGTLFF